MYEYEMDPTRTVGATEQTRDVGQMDEQMDRQTEGRMEWNQYTPQQLRCARGIITLVFTGLFINIMDHMPAGGRLVELVIPMTDNDIFMWVVLQANVKSRQWQLGVAGGGKTNIVSYKTSLMVMVQHTLDGTKSNTTKYVIVLNTYNAEIAYEILPHNSNVCNNWPKFQSQWH